MTDASQGQQLRVGTRDSQLALAQTHLCVNQLKQYHPTTDVSIISMKTIGDQVLSVPLSSIGTTALFTKELEKALLDNVVDAVVHSLKDVPTLMPEGLMLAAVVKREDPRDALVMRQGVKATRLEELKAGATVGTSSRRRTAQLRRLYPHLHFKDVRGNLNTRLRKLDAEDSPYDALVLAAAGLLRLGWHDRITGYLDMPYAVGQGAMAVQCRQSDVDTLTLMSSLQADTTRWECEAERQVMRRLEGGCSVPLGVKSTWQQDHTLTLEAVVTSMDGTRQVSAVASARVTNMHSAQELGSTVAAQMLQQGAAPILAEIRQVPPGDVAV